MTPRQSKLLKAIIDEFIHSAEAVGSVHLSNRYRLGVSPATIRNEMAELVKQGYLVKPHSSSGRIPTNLGFKFFLDKLLNEAEDMQVHEASNIKEQMFQSRFDIDSLIYEALNALSSQARNLALVLLGKRIYYAGFARLLNKPDYIGRDEVSEVFKIIEDYKLLRQIFNRYRGSKRIKVLIGEDTGYGSFAKTALIFSPIRLHGGTQGYVALIGPNRMNYAKNIPLLDFIASSLNQVVSGW